MTLTCCARTSCLAGRCSWREGLVAIPARGGWGGRSAGDGGIGEENEEVRVGAEGIRQGVGQACRGTCFGKGVGGLVATDTAVGTDFAEADTLRKSGSSLDDRLQEGLVWEAGSEPGPVEVLVEELQRGAAVCQKGDRTVSRAAGGAAFKGSQNRTQFPAHNV